MKQILLTLALCVGMFLTGVQAQVTLLNESFEGSTIPLGWTTVDADGDGHQWEHSSVQSVVYQGHTGSGAVVSFSKDLDTYTPLTPDNWLISPPITMVGNGTLTFWRQVGWSDYAEHYGVYISTTSPTDLTSFTLLYEETPGQGNQWTQRTVNLNGYAGSTVYIAFRHYNITNKLMVAIDDVVLTCENTSPLITADPNMLQFLSVPVGQNSASQQIAVEAFNIVGTVTASVAAPFEVSVNDTNFSNSVTFTPGTQPLYVRYSPTMEGSDSVVMTLTSGTVSTNVTLFGNSIDCNSIALPYEENFNDLLEFVLPGCWSSINPYYGCPMTSNDYSSDNVLLFKCDHVNAVPSYAVLPLMPDFLTNLQISFTTFREGYNSGTFSVGYLSDPADGSTFVPVWSINAAQIGDNNPHSYLVSFEDAVIDPNIDYHIAFKYISTHSVYWLLDDVVVEAIPSCAPPTNLNVGMVTHSTANVTWSGNANLYNIYYRPASETAWQEIANVNLDPQGYTIENLLSSTTYEWYVASVCDDTIINSLSNATFATFCSPFGIPYEEDFNASNTMPACWKRYNGWASDIFAGEPLSNTTSGWNFNLNTYVFGATHARVNICGNACNRWLVSPAIDLNGLTNPVLMFDLALTDYNNGSPIEDTTAQSDDKFMVIVSTDYGATWSAADATVWSNDGNGDYVFNQISTTGQEITISLADYVNDTVMIAFYAESSISGNGDNDLHVDNILVSFATNCVKPTNLTVQNVASDAVTLAWTENGSASAWKIEYGPTGFQHGSPNATLVTANSNPFTVSNLNPNEYDFYVQADCGGEVSHWSNMVTATPGIYNMGINSNDTLITCSMVICDNSGANGNYSAGCESMLVLYPETTGDNVGVLGTYHTEANFDKLRIYDGVGTSGTLLGEFSGNGTVPVLVATNGPLTIRFSSDNGTQYSGFVLNTFCSSCMPPVGLTVSNVGPDTADLSWSGAAAAYIVEYKAATATTWTQVDVTDTVFQLTGLSQSTTYTVNVYGGCADGQSIPATLTFTTTMGPETLPYYTDFSAGSDQSWLLDNGSCANYWMIGNADGNNSGLFITHNGTTPGYNTSLRGVVSAEKLFVVGTAEEVTISFDVKIGGETDFDYLKVFFAPSDVSYPATNTGASYPEYSNEGYSTNAVNFSDYLPYSEYPSFPYKYNLTGNQTVHVAVTMPNPNAAPTSASTAKLVFLWKNDNAGGDSQGAIIYNVSVEALTCPAPTGLTVTNITTNSANVSWTATGGETSWTLEYKEAGASAWTSVPVSGTPSYSLTGLNVGTAYQLRVQANCSGDDNSLWVANEFYTFCDAIAAFPYTEGFESGTMPDCWSQEHVFGFADWDFQAGDHPNDSLNEAHGGAYNAYFFENSEASSTTRLVSPIFDLSHVSDPYLTYWYAQKKWGSNQDHLTVYYRTSPSSDWQILLPHGQSVGVWTMDSIALPTPTATYQVAFGGEANHGYGIVLDDITINGEVDTTVVPEPCEVPTGLHQVVISYNGELSNQVTWDDDANVSQWNVQYKIEGSDWMMETVTENQFSIPAQYFHYNTDYPVRVQAVCDDGNTSEWSAPVTLMVPCGINDYFQNVILYPNPAKEVVNVQCTMNNVQLGGELHLLDVYGKLLQIVPITSETTRINVSGLANGMYFVRVTTEEGVVTKTFVKR